MSPVKLHADKGYDYPLCRRALRSRGIIPRIPGAASNRAGGWAYFGGLWSVRSLGSIASAASKCATSVTRTSISHSSGSAVPSSVEEQSTTARG
jgi:hypothetical protein